MPPDMPIDPNDPDAAARAAYHARLKAQDWRALIKRLTLYAFAALRRTSWHEAEDMAQKAMLAAHDPKKRAWDPEAQPDVFDFLTARVRDQLTERRRKKGNRAEVLHDHLELAELGSTDDDAEEKKQGGARPAFAGATPEELLAHEQRKRAVLGRLNEKFEDDAVARELVTITIQGVEGREAHAAALGCSVAMIKNARRRIGDRLDEIERELEGHGGDGHAET